MSIGAFADLVRRHVGTPAGRPPAYAAWMAEEGPFVAGQRAWERAFVTVCGSPAAPHDPHTEVVVEAGGQVAR